MELDAAADDDGGRVGGMTDSKSKAAEVVEDHPAGGADIWVPGYSPRIFWSPLRARRTWRSIRQKTSRARQITATSAATVLLVLHEDGGDGQGPLASP